MKVDRIIKWTLGDGRKAEAHISVTREMQDDIAYADGWNLNLGKKPYESFKIEVFIDGKFFERTFQYPQIVSTDNYFGADFVAKVKSMGGYARLTDRIIIKESVYNDIINAITEATAEAEQDQEYKDYITAKAEAEKAARSAKEAREKELTETPIPQEAIDAYNRYHGDEDKAWEDENETAWALIREWSPYIEAQYGMDKQKLLWIAKKAVREQNYGINER